MLYFRFSRNILIITSDSAIAIIYWKLVTKLSEIRSYKLVTSVKGIISAVKQKRNNIADIIGAVIYINNVDVEN